jgi:hypothetical protein
MQLWPLYYIIVGALFELFFLPRSIRDLTNPAVVVFCWPFYLIILTIHCALQAANHLEERWAAFIYGRRPFAYLMGQARRLIGTLSSLF